MDPFLLALDVGGCSVRCSLVDARQEASETVARGWAAVPEPEEGFFAFRTDTDRCWRLVVEVVREVVGRCGVPADGIAGLAVAGMRFSLVLVDRDGRVLYATPNHDARAAEEALQLADEMGSQLCRRAGRWPLPIFLAPPSALAQTSRAAIARERGERAEPQRLDRLEADRPDRHRPVAGGGEPVV
ncbi:MAG: hypothetical protein FJ000_02145 [Actinobacteria bacterium]|nr:hypothetical protein [Actinomycetota bacterium]